MNHRAVLGWLSFLAVSVALAVAACSEDTEPESDGSSTTVPAAVETTTTTTAPTTTAPAPTTTAPATTTTAPATTTTTAPATTTTTPTAAGFEVSIDGDTVWWDVLDGLAGAEQACIGEALGDELEAAMDLAVLSDDGDQEWQAPLLACLDPDTARELSLAIIIGGVEEDLIADVGPQEEACMRERLSDEDVPALIMADPESPEAARFTGEMMGCIPDVLFSMFMEEMLGATDAAGLEIREEQVSCVQDALAGTDWAMFIDGSEPEDPEAAADLLDGVVGCIPDVFVSLIVSEMEAETGDLSDEARSCLRGVVIDLDWSAILGGAETEILTEFLPGLIGCAPELLFLDDEGVLSGDDHGNLIDEATPAALGEAIEGVRDYDDDVDVFMFEAAAGELYQIDVTLGTLDDSAVTLYDADGLELGYNDDYGDTLASRLYREATDSGPHYIAVAGYGTGTGTYTLTVMVLDIVDDHGNVIDEATPAALDEAVEGVRDYGQDADFFVFEAAAGELYQIDVTPGTLEAPTVTLYDADGLELGHSDGYGYTSAPRLQWEATDSGPHYIAVAGYGYGTGTGTGTYTLAVTNFVEDHGDVIGEATPAALGEAVEGVLEWDYDADFFVFEAAAGEFYQIDVTPGTLADPIARLYDADGLELRYNDDYGDTLASRLYWVATDSGPLHVAVEGYGTGAYTLTVTALDFVDDHGDRNTVATPVALGEAIEGVLDYDEDVDVFMFEAAAGELYQIDVTPGTLETPIVTLRDADGLELAHYDDYGDTLASRLYREATNSGPHYVAVEGHGTGTYTLTIVER